MPINIEMHELHVIRCCQGKLELLTIKVCNELFDTLWHVFRTSSLHQINVMTILLQPCICFLEFRGLSFLAMSKQQNAFMSHARLLLSTAYNAVTASCWYSTAK